MLPEIEISLDFEGVLAHLLGWNGSWTWITLGAAGPGRMGTVMGITGTLRVQQIQERKQGDSFHLTIEEQAGCDVFLNEWDFSEAGIEPNGYLAIRLKRLLLGIGPGDPAHRRRQAER